MDGPNPSEMDIRVFIPTPTYCLQSKKVSSIKGKRLNISFVWKIKYKYKMHDLYMKITPLNKKTIQKIKLIITLVLTSSLFIAVHQSSLFRIKEKLVALLVYPSFIRVAISGFRIIPYSLAVVEVCA